MVSRVLILLYALVSYALFTISFLYALGFVGNYVVPKSIDKSIDVGSPANLERGHRRQPAADEPVCYPAQRDGASRVQTMVSQIPCPSLPAQHLCAALQPDPALAVLAVAADPDTDLAGERSCGLVADLQCIGSAG